MHRTTKPAAAAATALALALGAVAAPSGAAARHRRAAAAGPGHTSTVRLMPANPKLGACMPSARVTVRIDQTRARTGSDRFAVTAQGLPPRTTFTVFLLETLAPPHGAVEYVGDVRTGRRGRAHRTFRLVVADAFATRLVNGRLARVNLDEIGVWFADPAADDFCFGTGQGLVTPFDGDGTAGAQAFNSSDATPPPPPFPTGTRRVGRARIAPAPHG